MFFVPDSASKKTAAENQENVGEDGAEHARLHNANLSILQSNNTDLNSQLVERRWAELHAYYKFHGVAKSGVHQPSKRLTQFDREFFRRETEQRSQWYDGQKV